MLDQPRRTMSSSCRGTARGAVPRAVPYGLANASRSHGLLATPPIALVRTETKQGKAHVREIERERVRGVGGRRRDGWRATTRDSRNSHERCEDTGAARHLHVPRDEVVVLLVVLVRAIIKDLHSGARAHTRG